MKCSPIVNLMLKLSRSYFEFNTYVLLLNIQENRAGFWMIESSNEAMLNVVCTLRF